MSNCLSFSNACLFLLLFSLSNLSLAQDPSDDFVKKNVVPFVDQFNKGFSKYLLQGTQYGNVPYQGEQNQKVIEDSKNAYLQAKKKVADFKSQYKKPPECYDMKDNTTRVHCANHFMSARAAYEAAHK